MSPPARSPFAYLSSPPQQRTPPASVQRDHPSPHTFLPAPTGAPEPNFPQYPFGPPYSTAPRPSRGSKRGRGSDSGLRFQGRTSKRPRLAGNPHVGVASNATPAVLVASSSRSAISPPPRAVASNKENPHTLPAGPPPPSWGVVPSARENRTTHGVAKVRVPYAPSTLNSPLSSTPPAGPSSSVQKSTSNPVSALLVPSLDQARYPTSREAQGLSREIRKDIKPVGAELYSCAGDMPRLPASS
ncbi:hypothetical protein L226DRAFT_289281 [Lentinus tigrinus ALCF2SS1-7]|uniref:uncharacterized protein n=1 Tax=Lentinus tigrinus ALCF2SS1-7 TaxID=1328758 RepID=UPI001165EFD4|nr:hypothetical protein L226DRAFT_289281 [Lentinus tigrinus ALCF2SS1-7]